MNTQEWRTTRGNRRRKAVIDLNVEPRDQEGTSASVRASPTVPSGDIPEAISPPPQPAPTMIDVDAIEDDVIESSASAFAEVCFLSHFDVLDRLSLSKKLTNFCFVLNFDTRLKANRQVDVDVGGF